MSIKPAKLFIWDLDNCIYPYDDVFWNMIHEASARAVLRLLGRHDNSAFTFDALKQLARQSQRLYGEANKLAVEQFGLDKEETFQGFLRELTYDFLKPNHALGALFKHSHVKHVILTHNSAARALTIIHNLGLGQVFTNDAIVSVQDEGIAAKHVGTAAFDTVLSRFGFRAEDALVIEDTAINLRHPKEMGMQTVFVSYGKGDGEGHAEHVFNTAQDFLAAYCRQVKAPARER
jgi:FMN phosphatase YigB (HAD superfamily)